MKLKFNLFNPVTIPVNITSNLIGLGLKLLREKYIAKHYKQDLRLNALLAEYQLLANTHNIPVNKDIKIRVINTPNTSIISNLFESFDSKNHIYKYFNTILVNQEFLDTANSHHIKSEIIRALGDTHTQKPIKEYLLDKSLLLIITISLIIAANCITLTTTATTGLLCTFAALSLIKVGICKLADIFFNYQSKRLAKNLFGDELNQPTSPTSVISPSHSSEVSRTATTAGLLSSDLSSSISTDTASRDSSIARTSTSSVEYSTDNPIPRISV